MLILCRRVRTTLAEQSEGWKERPVFERQWVVRDFKKHAGMPVEQWLEVLERLERHTEARDLAALAGIYAPLGALVSYYVHLQELAKGYVKDPVQLEEHLQIVRGWQEKAKKLKDLLARSRPQ